MNRTLQLILLLMLIFAGGGACGWFLRPLNMIENAERRDRWQSGTPRQRAEAILEELTTELSLSEQQQAEIRPLLQENFRTTAQIDQERLRRRKLAHDEVVKRIREKLDSGQQQKLDALDDSSNRRFRRVFERTGLEDGP